MSAVDFLSYYYLIRECLSIENYEGGKSYSLHLSRKEGATIEYTMCMLD